LPEAVSAQGDTGWWLGAVDLAGAGVVDIAVLRID